MLLQKTWLYTREFDSCKYKLGFQKFLVVSSIGKKGGISLLWNYDVDLSILNYSFNHIDDVIKVVNQSVGQWFLTAVYGFPETHLKYRTWNLLKSLSRMHGEA